MDPIALKATRRLVGAVLVALTACATPSAVPPGPPTVTLGPMAGDVTATSAVLWARGDRVGRLHARISEEGGANPIERSVPIFRVDDWTGKLEVHGLRPDTRYEVSVRLLAPGTDGETAGPALSGRFRTAPAAHERRPVRLAFGGDLAGQNVCRHESEGFPIFRAVAAVRPNLFVGLGDMIYADGVCTAVGRYGNAQIPGAFEPAARMLNFWAHWRYSREDEAFRHEVVNDFGPHDDTRDGGPYSADEQLMPLGLAAFLDYNPVPERDVPEGRIFRSVRWGRHLELFVLDTRQYRDPAGEADDPADPKTLLGAEQREWLKQALVRSDATWKVVVTSVPLSIPGGRPLRRGPPLRALRRLRLPPARGRGGSAQRRALRERPHGRDPRRRAAFRLRPRGPRGALDLGGGAPLLQLRPARDRRARGAHDPDREHRWRDRLRPSAGALSETGFHEVNVRILRVGVYLEQPPATRARPPGGC
jgi:alkaline phosphatase D